MKTTTKFITAITTLLVGLSLTSTANAGDRYHTRNAPVVITESAYGYEVPRFRNDVAYRHHYYGRDYAYSRTPKIDKKIRRLKRKKVKKLRRMRRISERYYHHRPIAHPAMVNRVPVYDRPVIVIPVHFMR